MTLTRVGAGRFDSGRGRCGRVGRGVATYRRTDDCTDTLLEQVAANPGATRGQMTDRQTHD